jgi:hypothetical protein
MMACISPAFTSKEKPFKISLLSMDACKLCILSIVIVYFISRKDAKKQSAQRF